MKSCISTVNRMTEDEADELTRSYLRFAISRARKMCPCHLRDEAESVALIGLAKAVLSWPGRDDVPFSSWAVVVIRREILDLLKTESRPRRFGRPCVTLNPNSSKLADARASDARLKSEEFEAFAHRIGPLDEIEKRMFSLVFIEGLDVTAAGAVVGLKRSNAHRSYHAALARLRDTSTV